MAWNQTINGSLVSWKMVPDVGLVHPCLLRKQGRLRMVAAVLALKQAPGEKAVPGGSALGADETLPPASLADGLTALRFGGVGRVELPQREALLKLDVVAGHGFPHAHSIVQ